MKNLWTQEESNNYKTDLELRVYTSKLLGRSDELVLTPEHIIRTKREPLILEDDDIQSEIDKYKENYIKYFNTYKKDEIMLNPAPNWVVVKNFGTVSFGKNEKEANIIEDINNHTMKAVSKADMLGGYKSISLQDSFEMEYWELKQELA